MASTENVPEKKVKLEQRGYAAGSHRSWYGSVHGYLMAHANTDGLVAQEAMEKFSVEKVREMELYMVSGTNGEKDIAQHIKREFDSKKGATWHCIVGRNFGSFVTHETKHFIYFYLGHVAILLFKTQ
ncbi:dynein light chain LC8-type [Exophiala aquamarina CBS 119918]|uniref:Dynein light chain n=1 Tax=Exophiala aquamarina CBS 119918 TaxID=1182545 RepID=A0A072P1U4_9EURO|nr:dynein light chain LC8-type [Exophiala aquamarina CBS 119918]KEF53248.1 dynein light chain LC8-type [Exophiala aquamarina CBS 119918]